jgi:asparaginyl-tRNA synthetase
LRARLQNVADSEFARITYTEAVNLLQTDSKAGKIVFDRYPEWGDDLGSEHERYLAEKVRSFQSDNKDSLIVTIVQIYKRPTIVSNYPKGIKAFYMKLNDDGQTVAAMDILVPKIGELIGGSQR